MPVILLERLPLPSLRTYTAISVTLLACAIYFAQQTLYDIREVSEHVPDSSDVRSNITEPTVNSTYEIKNGTNDTTDITEVRELNETEYVPDNIVEVLLQETWCVATLINMAYCCLILIGKAIQKIVFGELRVSEQQHIKDKFWNFVFYKFIFIFGVMNVQLMDEVLYWCAWFSVLGFLHLLAQLCKDRFEYLSFSPTTPSWTHAKVLMLLIAIQGACLSLLSICIYIGYMYAGLNTFAFMSAECILLIIRTFYVLTRYAIHLVDLNNDGVWENRAIYVYYSELIFELAGLSVDFGHHLHMLVWGNIFLSMASLVICMQLRYLFHEVQRRVKRHKNYLRVVSSMEAKFPMATPDDLNDNNDDCAICWEKMESARKLPCGHLFHDACLRSWLEQDTSCPTCRMSLSDLQATDRERANHQRIDAAGDAQAPQNIAMAPPGNHFTNHFFQFDGSRYVSWLPSFSVEVTHTQILGNAPRPTSMQSSQLDNMTRQVQEVFPNMPVEIILDDIRVTLSVEITIENIIEGRVTVPVNYRANHRESDNNNSDTDSQGSRASEASNLDELEDDTPSASPVLSPTPELPDPGPQTLDFSSDVKPPDPPSAGDAHGGELEPPSGFGGRFSKSPLERETMLSSRKESLVEQARRKYLSRSFEPLSTEAPVGNAGTPGLPPSELFASSPDASHNFTSEGLRIRRELAFRAALSRMNQQE